MSPEIRVIDKRWSAIDQIVVRTAAARRLDLAQHRSGRKAAGRGRQLEKCGRAGKANRNRDRSLARLKESVLACSNT